MKTRADYPEFGCGQLVRSRDGHHVGHVVMNDDQQFVVEKGVFFPKDFTVSFEDVYELKNGELILKHLHEELLPWKKADYAGWSKHVFKTAEGLDDAEKKERQAG